MGIAIGTVTRAYQLAEQRGLIHGEGRRGTFVGEPKRGKSSLADLTSARPQDIDLSVNYPTYSEDPDLRLALRRLSRDPALVQLLMYAPPEGMPRHRQAGAQWIKGLGLNVEADAVLVTAGAQHALTAALAAVTKPGDTLLTESLTYPGIKALGGMLGLRLKGVPMDGEGLLPGALEACCRKWKPRALYTIPTVQNPTTGVLSEARRREIAAVAEHYNLEILEDEIHRSLVASPPPLLASIAPGRTFFVASPSKVVAGGLRSGFLVAPEKYHREVIQALQAITVAVSPLTMEILARWIEDGTAAETVARRRREARARRRLAEKYLDGFSYRAHPTGYYVWLLLPEAWSRMEFAMQAQQRGVAVAPADTFAVATEGVEIPEAVRISLGTPDHRERLEKGLVILAELLKDAPRSTRTRM
jgi:DNA-binding transcriptional MocR family regulator